MRFISNQGDGNENGYDNLNTLSYPASSSLNCFGALSGWEKGSPGAPGLRHQRIPGNEDEAVTGAGIETQGYPEGVA